MSPEEMLADRRSPVGTLVYVRQEGKKIIHCYKGPEDGCYATTEISPLKALRMAEDLVRMASFALQPAG